MARAIKKKILTRTGLTASAGIAPNKFLAKIASDWKKPDGLVEIKPEDVGSFLENLPISKLWGVGKATEEVLKGIGIFRVGQLARHPPEAIEKKLGKFGLELLALARGEDDRPVVSNEEAKSVSQEQTFTPDLRDRQVMEQMLLDQAEQVGWEMRKQKLKGFTVHLKVRYPDFTLTTRSQTLPFPTDAGMEIYRTAVKLLDKTEALSRKARLLGVGVSNLHRGDTPFQRGLFDSYREKEEKSLEAVDQIWEKFGPEAIQRASLLERKKK
jgi:nucleotidyltransferase/DNA polymerase involved in DNA repair